MLVKRNAILAACVGVVTATASGAAIEATDILPIPGNAVGSGNGTLDLRLMTYSGGEIPNSGGTFDGDNGNNTLPQGGGTDTFSFAESYVTTAGELKAFYLLNFPNQTIDELVVFIDLNETGGGEPTNGLLTFDIVVNPTITGVNPVNNDVLSGAQAGINQASSGGTLSSWLTSTHNLAVNNQGAGWADYAIFTGIQLSTLNNNDVVLFNVSMDSLNDGAEEVFISGRYSPSDVPEPAALLTLAISGLLLIRRKPTVH